MAASPTRSALVEVKAIDNSHPFYGSTTPNRRRLLRGSPHSLNEGPKVWVSPEVLVQFKVKLGETLRLGATDFTISHQIEDDTGQSLAGAACPRIYIGLDQLDGTELITTGSTAWRNINVLLDDESNIDEIEKSIFQSMDNTVRVASYKKSGQDNGRTLKYLTDYLGLVSLVALFLSGIGIFYLFLKLYQ